MGSSAQRGGGPQVRAQGTLSVACAPGRPDQINAQRMRPRRRIVRLILLTSVIGPNVSQKCGRDMNLPHYDTCRYLQIQFWYLKANTFIFTCWKNILPSIRINETTPCHRSSGISSAGTRPIFKIPESRNARALKLHAAQYSTSYTRAGSPGGSRRGAQRRL